MDIPPISDEEVESERLELAKVASIPEDKQYIVRNMVLIRKCFGDRAYAAALANLHSQYALSTI